MNEPINVNLAAPLKNVASFSILLAKMVDRDSDQPGLACFYGPSGWGKSKAAVYGANKYRAAYVECGQYTSAKSLMEQILIELGIQRARGSIEQLKSQAIMAMVAEQRRPLIIDEAHFIAKKQFVDLLRELSDKSGAPVIMIGEEMLPQDLERFERVHNRVLEWLPAVACDMEDFYLLASRRCRDVKIGQDLAAAILKTTEGNTRRVVTNLSKIAEAARVQGAAEFTLTTYPAELIVGRATFRARAYK